MDKTSEVFEDLLVLIRTLRGEGGCPWDRKQTIQTLKVYLEQELVDKRLIVEVKIEIKEPELTIIAVVDPDEEEVLEIRESA